MIDSIEYYIEGSILGGTDNVNNRVTSNSYSIINIRHSILYCIVFGIMTV